MARVGVLCWQAAYRGILPAEFLAGLSVEPRAVAWETLLEAEGSKDAPTWVAERDGRVTGYLSSGPPRDDDTPLHTAEIYAVYVLPGKWRQGAGRALLDAAVEYWLEHGAAGARALDFRGKCFGPRLLRGVELAAGRGAPGDRSRRVLGSGGPLPTGAGGRQTGLAPKA